jgi:hypothetical protein
MENNASHAELPLTLRQAEKLDVMLTEFAREMRALEKDAKRHRAEMHRLETSSRRKLEETRKVLEHVEATF